MIKVSPCKDCSDRALRCHASCKKYDDWVSKRKAEIDFNRKNTYIIRRPSCYTGTSPKPGKHRKTKGTKR